MGFSIIDALKFIPGPIGAAVCVGEGLWKLSKGDFVGAGLDLVGGAVSFIPGGGIAAKGVEEIGEKAFANVATKAAETAAAKAGEKVVAKESAESLSSAMSGANGANAATRFSNASADQAAQRAADNAAARAANKGGDEAAQKAAAEKAAQASIDASAASKGGIAYRTSQRLIDHASTVIGNAATRRNPSTIFNATYLKDMGTASLGHVSNMAALVAAHPKIVTAAKLASVPM